MGLNNPKATKVSLVPLPKGSVLLPGVSLRIPVSNRPDLANLLSTVLEKSNAGKRDGNTVAFGCIPLNSPFLSKDGQNLIEGGGSDDEKEEYESIDAGQARTEDLFRYGTIGKVVGIQRRAFAEPFLLVQGTQRFTVKRVVKERPFFEAEAIIHEEKGKRFAELLVDKMANSLIVRITIEGF
jgi:ATP-dependent Lon protease